MPYRNILLIDDDEDDQEIFLIALQKLNSGVQCTAIDAATVALDKLESKEINPELIFLDLNMPVMNGQQFLKEIKKREALSNIPVVILSTSSNNSTKQYVKELGAADFFSKPDRFEDLIDILKTVLTR